MKKYIKVILWILIILIVMMGIAFKSYAFNKTNTSFTYNENPLVNLTAPSYYDIIHYDNMSVYLWNISCQENSSFHSSTNKCEIERHLNFGENYKVNDGLCDVQFYCEECDEQKIEEKIYYATFKFEKGNETFNITFEETNETWDFDFTDLTMSEKEFAVMCPYKEDTECSSSGYNPDFNVTDEAWWWMCGNALNTVMKGFGDTTTSLTGWQDKLNTDYATCTASNVALASENGALKEKIVSLDTCISERTMYKSAKDNCMLNIQKCKEDRLNNKSELIGYQWATAILAMAFIFMFMLWWTERCNKEV